MKHQENVCKNLSNNDYNNSKYYSQIQSDHFRKNGRGLLSTFLQNKKFFGLSGFVYKYLPNFISLTLKFLKCHYPSNAVNLEIAFVYPSSLNLVVV